MATDIQGTVQTAASRLVDTTAAAAELAALLDAEDLELVLYFASSRHDLTALAAALRERLPGPTLVGCTTMGEIGPAGLTSGAVSAIGIRAPARVAARLIDLSSFHFEDGAVLVADLVAALGAGSAPLSPARHVFLTLTDGLSGMEELLVASLGTHAPGIGLVGGSAADDFEFERTWVACDGEVRSGAAAVVLLEPRVPFHAFHLHHFRPAERRVVVTRASPRRRLVHEMDGWPAVEVLADLLQMEPDALRDDPDAAARAPVAFAFRVGDAFYMRTVMTVQGDALLMGGAVEEGAVLRVMQGGDLVRATGDGVRDALDALDGEPAGLVLFNCGGRLIEARARSEESQLFDAMTPVPTAGFTTYGEQYGPVQVNSTLTGLVIGRERRGH